jgi:tRNA-dihydrouridine synthase
MFETATIRGIPLTPARVCAPLAGITHSAFRRLVAEFGGCGALWTEMLAAKQILREDVRTSPCLRRRPVEKRVIYQLMVRDADPLDRVIGRLSDARPDGLDINLACHAPAIRSVRAGSRLFENPAVLRAVLDTARRCWPGLLTVKVRLGRDRPGWRELFAERMRLFEDCGVDAVVLHPRFFEDKFKRRARHELLSWAASLARLPLIASGDITGPESAAALGERLAPACALMIGRMAAVRPWAFASWTRPVEVDHGAVWRQMCDYIAEDFASELVLGRIRLFARYYARNFKFGHGFESAIRNVPSVSAARERAEEFFRRCPALDGEPSLMGL